VLGEVISAALRAGLEAFHQVGPRRDASRHRISVAADAARPGPAPANAPPTDLADIPRIPRRAIARGTRHV
jgi:hypothetical protein